MKYLLSILIACSLASTASAQDFAIVLGPEKNDAPNSNWNIGDANTTIKSYLVHLDNGPDYPARSLEVTYWVSDSSTVKFKPQSQQTNIPAGWEIISLGDGHMKLTNNVVFAQGVDAEVKAQMDPVGVTSSTVLYGQVEFVGYTPTNNLTANDLQWYDVRVAAPLPIKLLSIDAQSRDCSSIINWATAKESNVSRFEIQRSTDGANFKTVGQVSPKGNNGEHAKYSFVDMNPVQNAKNIYRLKTIDLDETYSLSKNVYTVTRCNNQSISVYPNPVTNNKLNISFDQIATNSKYVIRFVDISGRVVLSDEFSTDSDMIKSYDLSNLNAGIYTINILDGNHSNSFKILKK